MALQWILFIKGKMDNVSKLLTNRPKSVQVAANPCNFWQSLLERTYNDLGHKPKKKWSMIYFDKRKALRVELVIIVQSTNLIKTMVLVTPQTRRSNKHIYLRPEAWACVTGTFSSELTICSFSCEYSGKKKIIHRCRTNKCTLSDKQKTKIFRITMITIRTFFFIILKHKKMKMKTKPTLIMQNMRKPLLRILVLV